jgi:hypothetical protein
VISGTLLKSALADTIYYATVRGLAGDSDIMNILYQSRPAYRKFTVCFSRFFM